MNYHRPLEVKDESLVSHGRIVVLCSIGFVVAASLAWMLLFESVGETPPFVRLLVTLGLAYCLYRGQTWARYLMVGLCGFAAVMSLIGLFTSPADVHPALLVYLIVMVAGYAGVAIVLAMSRSVSEFMADQRFG